ncbi:MAG: M16 family metallopeptidase [Chitinophagaceae bacterium]
MKISVRLAMLWIFTGTFFLGIAQQKPVEKLTTDPKVIKGKLPNGLTYYIRKNSLPEKKVEMRLAINVGSIVEDNSQRGLAHMAEHMAFNGTKNFRKNDIVSFLQSIGVEFGSDLNAFTSFDETVYILPIPIEDPKNLEKGFQVLEDWAHNVTYNEEDINNERAIILEESRLGKSAQERMFKKIFPELFNGSKYAERLPIGVDSIIKNFPANELRRFYKEWYRPDLMAVVIVGDIDPKLALSLINKHFAKLKSPAKPRKRESFQVYPYKESKAMVVTDPEATGYTYIMNYPFYKIQPTTTITQYRDDIIQTLFSSLLNNRFRELSQKENPPFVFAAGDFNSYAKGYEGFGVQASSGNNDIKKAIAAVTEEIERVKRYGFSESELERAKKSVNATYENLWNNRDKMESGDLAEELVRNFTQQEPVPGIEKEFNLIKKILPQIQLSDVNKVIDRFRDEKNRFAFVLGPESKDRAPKEDQILALVAAKEQEAIKPYEEKALPTALISYDPTPVKALSKSRNESLGSTEIRFNNGITVTLKTTSFKDDQILLSSTRYGGTSGYPNQDKYNAEYAATIVGAMGVSNFSPIDLRKMLAGKTATLSPTITGTQEGFDGRSSKKDLETMFQLLHLFVNQPRKDSTLFNSWIQRNKAQYSMAKSNPQYAFIDTLYRVLFSNHPKTPITIPKVEYFDSINLDRSFAIYKERLSDLSGMHFTIVGSFKDEEIMPLLEKYLGSFQTNGSTYNYTDNKLRPITGNNGFVFNKGKDEKSLIIEINHGEIPYTSETKLKLNALSEVLNIKIIEELREKIQGIYGGGTSFNMTSVPYNYYQFILQLPCGPEKVDTLIKTYHNELTDLALNGPAESYISKVKKQWLEQYRVGMQTNEFWLSKLEDIHLGLLNDDWLLHWEKYVNTLNISDIKEAAKIIINSKTRLVAVMMPE